MPVSLAGKIALITGASSGIGRAAALVFAREGAKVVIAARRAGEGEAVSSEIRASGGTALFVRADVSEPGQVNALIDQTVKTYGRLDCAVNNAAALWNDSKRTGDYSEQDFDREVDGNLKSVWLCLRGELRQMQRQEKPGGAIVNVSSVNGLGAAAGAALYSMAKAGVLALTKAAAMEYAAEGIRVNALVAGAFNTPMLNQAIGRAAGGDAVRREKMEQQFLSMLPLRRIGNPEEAAEALLWLCSDASSYVTGHSMIVDGGLTSWAR
ncbi:MAG TPA: glucose 1-dehydrogenase [Bryobacteraceae bacterium]|nr:glucose 1-dehydrogenase [Bryobacteraceae bacterium]